MRITIQALIESVKGGEPLTETIGVVERDADGAPASGPGLFLRETHALLRQLQAIVLREQVAQFVERASRCRQCGGRLATKDSKTVVYRTAFGKARLDSPRLYSRCSGCGACASAQASFSPLTEALPERTHPQWLWLQSRYASVMSYRLAQVFLRDAFPAGKSLRVSSVKANLRRIGQRLDAETQAAVDAILRGPCGAPGDSPPRGPAIELEVDAGYIRAEPSREGVRWISVIASKLVRPVARRGYAHAYAGSYNPHQGVRQQAFLASLGVPPDARVTMLSDGGDDVEFACRLPRPTERVLDWFHISMRFEHLLTGVRGLRHADDVTKFPQPAGQADPVPAELSRPADQLRQALPRGSPDLNEQRRVGRRLRDRPANEEKGPHALEPRGRQRTAAGALRGAKRVGRAALQTLVPARPAARRPDGGHGRVIDRPHSWPLSSQR